MLSALVWSIQAREAKIICLDSTLYPVVLLGNTENILHQGGNEDYYVDEGGVKCVVLFGYRVQIHFKDGMEWISIPHS